MKLATGALLDGLPVKPGAMVRPDILRLAQADIIAKGRRRAGAVRGPDQRRAALTAKSRSRRNSA